MKKIFLTLMMLIASITTVFALPLDKYSISRDDLPDAAKEMLDTYFPKAKISMIKVDKHFLKKSDYDVKLLDGTMIEFSNNGKWTSVTRTKKAVPEELIPKAIRRYMDKNYKESTILSITKKVSGYIIGISDGKKLKFDLLGTFKGIESE